MHEIGGSLVDHNELDFHAAEIAADVVFYVEHQPFQSTFTLARLAEHRDVDVAGSSLRTPGAAAEKPRSHDIVSEFEPVLDDLDEGVSIHRPIVDRRRVGLFSTGC